jgi:hypothetical protein
MTESSSAHAEPLSITLRRTVTIAAVAGVAVALRWGGLRQWPQAAVIMLWFSLGGHYVELCYLRVVRPRLPSHRIARTGARIVTWFVGGVALGLGAAGTAMLFGRAVPARLNAWWMGGFVLISIELVVHAVLLARGKPGFFDGRD